MITAENLSFSYTGAPPFVLDGVSFMIQDGEYVSVVGENGSGKTTLMKLILRFLKPTRGSVTTDAVRVGYVPQRTGDRNTGFPITVREMLNSYRNILKIKDKSVIDCSLAQVGLPDKADALMGSLSGGQSQRALIARALMGDPQLIILDEPSTGVDPENQREIYALVKKLNAERGITIVSVEHNLDAAVRNSSLIYHLENGRGHVCTTEQFAREYLGEGGDHA